MKVLGLHLGHDSSAALIVNGKIIADIQEERFKRIKHYNGLPFESIKYCLEEGNISFKDLDAIALSSKSPNIKINEFFRFSEKRQRIKKGFKSKVKGLIFEQSVNTKMPTYFPKYSIASHTKIINVEHHLAHAASAYYTCGSKEKQLIITMDGIGDNVSTAVWRGEKNRIIPLKKWNRSSSIATFYSNITEAIGWIHGDGEGKTMGLAPYGNPKLRKNILTEYYPKFKDGELIKPYDFGQGYTWNEHGANQYHFEDAVELKKVIDKYGREDIAATAQEIIEEQCFNLIFPWLEKEKTKNLCCSGGLFLNVKLNQRIWESGKVEQQHIYPNPGDSGLSVGAALQVYYSSSPNEPIHYIDNLYSGPKFSNEAIEEILKLRNLTYKFHSDIEVKTAKKLAEGKIIGWFQGRMEAGPRALGNRSILMSANDSKAKEVINARVKFREGFRPFCPSILWEKRANYLENFRDELFMITSFTCTKEKREKVPAVVHADSTMRPQTVKKSINERYWKLINEFGNLTGEYLLLNTSFNVMGEPIVLHPRDAIRCFFDNGLDVLVLGNYMIEK